MNTFLISMVAYSKDAIPAFNYFFHDFVKSENNFLTEKEVRHYVDTKSFTGKVERLAILNIVKLGDDK